MTPILDKFDLSQPTWIKIKAYLEAELAKLRVKNDGDMIEKETIALRADIRRIKLLLDLEKEPITVEDVDTFPDAG